MSSNVASILNEARFRYETPLGFFLINGGEGASLNYGPATNRIELVGEGQSLMFHNLGSVIVHIRWGAGDVEATLNSMPILIGPTPTILTIPAVEQADWIAGITAGGTGRLLIHRGWGV